MRRLRLLLVLFLCTVLQLQAQEFINLTAREVRIDSLLPVYHHEFPLGSTHRDSTFTVSIEYPEFIDMQPADVARYKAISGKALPQLPLVEQFVGVSRGEGTLYVSLVPLVFRDGKYQKLVSFQLKKHATPKAARSRAARAAGDSIYASHSVLANGRWARISVPATGVYQLTDAIVRRAGFSNINKVKIYGYGGALQPEVLTASYLASTDDLHEVPQCIVGGRHLFHAVGPVSWSSSAAPTRTRNPYSDVGCYFITQSDEGEPLTADSADFVKAFYPTNNDYHSLYEVDDFAWYHSGRNLYESTPLTTTARTIELPAHTDSGTLTVVMTYDGRCSYSVEVNDSLVGTVAINNAPNDNSKAEVITKQFALNGMLRSNNTVRLRQTDGKALMRLDYVALTMPEPAAAPRLSSASFPTPTLDFLITNQDHHADTPVDMVIIIPATLKLKAQAERLKQYHEEHDSLRVRIISADELYNEFSSGTPDANAYRRYLRMLYERADSEADMPRYLLLFGDGAWDNRLLSGGWRNYSPHDFLLCYESENSFSSTMSYVSDDYFCLLDEGEGGNLTKRDKTDVGVGRLPARTDAEAKIMVDKILAYANNEHAGDWQNALCFMGDDGNNNTHMKDVDDAAQLVLAQHPAYNVRKIYWDAYERSSQATGHRYPDVEKLSRQQMQSGALVIDYCGHGAPYCISHEQVLRTEDFAAATSLRLPLWVTASCDIMPFDTQEENIGETAMLNTRGGAVAFFGTTRTVYTGDNKNMNTAFLKHVLTIEDGRCRSLGDAVRLSKNEVRAIGEQPGDYGTEGYPINKLHYTLLGDPALRLAAPSMSIVIDSINGHSLSKGSVTLAAGQKVTVEGHVENASDFNGVLSLLVKDVERTVVCRLNDQGADGAEEEFVFTDRPTTIYTGQDSVRHGRFNISFVLPQDISYSDAPGQMIAYALSNDRQREAQGQTTAFSMSGQADVATDGIGPSIYCYLNTSSFQNGGAVNTTPYFFAQITDKDGINAAGSSLGHDLELTVDGEMAMTYNLNEYFRYDFGDYRSGTVGYSLPELSEGEHHLSFRAWDVLNNSSVAELTFNVVRSLQPNCFSVECTRNPATTSTSFIINHDRTGSEMDVELEVFDTSGRLLWRKGETGISTDNTYTLDWDLTTSSGNRLQTGVYLYRVLISSDGSKKASQAQKLIVLIK